MGEMKHLVMAKFKEGVAVEEIIKEMEKMVSEVDLVLSFEWGEDVQSPEMLRQGFTHAFLMTFRSQEEFASFVVHPQHVDFSTTFTAAIDNVILLDFPTVAVKPKVDIKPVVVDTADATAVEAPPPPAATETEPPPAAQAAALAEEAPSQPVA
uniref:Cyclase3 n=1 Tax=Plumbago zeylanica TaxID=76149 RepID=A0A9E7Q7W0_9CARY|nr:Cyclase3 [Plumbago zeylanica]